MSVPWSKNMFSFRFTSSQHAARRFLSSRHCKTLQNHHLRFENVQSNTVLLTRPTGSSSMMVVVVFAFLRRGRQAGGTDGRRTDGMGGTGWAGRSPLGPARAAGWGVGGATMRIFKPFLVVVSWSSSPRSRNIDFRSPLCHGGVAPNHRGPSSVIDSLVSFFSCCGPSLVGRLAQRAGTLLATSSKSTCIVLEIWHQTLTGSHSMKLEQNKGLISRASRLGTLVLVPVSVWRRVCGVFFVFLAHV